MAESVSRTASSDEEIVAHARVHARSVAAEIGVDLDDVAWTVSSRANSGPARGQ